MIKKKTSSLEEELFTKNHMLSVCMWSNTSTKRWIHQ